MRLTSLRKCIYDLGGVVTVNLRIDIYQEFGVKAALALRNAQDHVKKCVWSSS